MTVNPEDIPEMEYDEIDGVQEVKPFQFLGAGDFGDFRPIIQEVSADDIEVDVENEDPKDESS